MSDEHKCATLRHRFGNDELSRRGFVKQASALGAAAATSTLSSRVLAQEASPLPAEHAVASPVAAGGPSLFESDELRTIMTFNIAQGGDLEAWDERKGTMLDLLRQEIPLFIGTQEALAGQLEYLEQNLEGYDYLGISRQGNTEDEYNAILYDTARVTVEESGTFWLSNAPSEPGSMLPGEGHPRIATWGRFSILGHPSNVYMFNTHLTFEEQGVIKQISVLLEELERIVAPGAEVIITGDFNRPRFTFVWEMFQKAGFRDAWQLADIHAGPPVTFHDWMGVDARGGFEQGVVADEGDYQIDWILYRSGGTTPISSTLLVQPLTYHSGDIYPSDHFPVMLTTLGNPDFGADALKVSPQALSANDPLSASATVSNAGEAGVAEVTLYVDRVPADSRWVTLASDESREVTFETRLYEPGEHGLTIQLLPGEVVTVKGVPPTLVLLDLNAEAYVLPDQVIPLEASIENQGSYEGTVEINMFVDDQRAASSIVQVAPGEVAEVGFVHSFESPGAYSVAIGSKSMAISVMVELASEWKFHRGDEPGWMDPALDDSSWETVELPASWEETSDYTEDQVFGWYRQTFTIPQEWDGHPLRLIVGQIDDADKTYFNGTLIGETGRFPDDEDGFESKWDTIREYTVPAKLVNFGSDNVIAVRVYDDLGGGGIHNGPLGILPLDEGQIQDEEEGN